MQLQALRRAQRGGPAGRVHGFSRRYWGCSPPPAKRAEPALTAHRSGRAGGGARTCFMFGHAMAVYAYFWGQRRLAFSLGCTKGQLLQSWARVMVHGATCGQSASPRGVLVAPRAASGGCIVHYATGWRQGCSAYWANLPGFPSFAQFRVDQQLRHFGLLNSGHDGQLARHLRNVSASRYCRHNLFAP